MAIIEALAAFDVDLEQRTALGSTPLMIAVSTNQIAAVRLLLEFNVDVTKCSKNNYNVSHSTNVEIRALLADHAAKSVSHFVSLF